MKLRVTVRIIFGLDHLGSGDYAHRVRFSVLQPRGQSANWPTVTASGATSDSGGGLGGLHTPHRRCVSEAL